jgi:hypothetical protein
MSLTYEDVHESLQEENENWAPGSVGGGDEGKGIGSQTEGAARSNKLIEDNGVDKKFRKQFRQAVAEATVGKPKLRSRFHIFLKCVKEKSIARRAGVTEQNVQKQFAAVIERIAHQAGINQKYTTPYKFKRTVKNLI